MIPLENVQKLFTSPWAALAGWIHYLAFDLFMGARIARGIAEQGLPRWPLVLLLPLTFLFGPIGYLAFEIIKATNLRLRTASMTLASPLLTRAAWPSRFFFSRSMRSHFSMRACFMA